MINLLPRQPKKDLRRDYLKRLTIVFGLILIVVFAVDLILLGGLWFALHIKERGLGYLAVKDAASEEARFDALAVQVSKLNEETTLIMSLAEKINTVSLIDVVLVSRPDGVAINKIEVGETDGGPFVSIEGIFNRRQIFDEFVKTLQGRPEISEVVSPVSNLIKDRSGPFTIEIKFNDEI